jgi:hypothetical protein
MNAAEDAENTEGGDSSPPSCNVADGRSYFFFLAAFFFGAAFFAFFMGIVLIPPLRRSDLPAFVAASSRKNGEGDRSTPPY